MSGDNGKDQVGSQIGALPAVNKVMVLTIYVDKVTQRVEVEGLLTNKPLCLNALAEAIKAVTNFAPSPIIQPAKGGILGFARKIMGRH